MPRDVRIPDELGRTCDFQQTKKEKNMNKFTVTTFTADEVYEAWKRANPDHEKIPGRPDGFALRRCGDGSIELTWDTFDPRGDECTVNLYEDDVAALLGVKPEDVYNTGWNGQDIDSSAFQIWQPIG
jgi:hypothetical protein